MKKELIERPCIECKNPFSPRHYRNTICSTACKKIRIKRRASAYQKYCNMVTPEAISIKFRKRLSVAADGVRIAEHLRRYSVMVNSWCQ